MTEVKKSAKIAEKTTKNTASLPAGRQEESAVKKVAPKKTTAKKDMAGTGSFAVIETGGKQYIVRKGETLKIEKLAGEHEVGGKITFDKVLLFDDGKDTNVGTPYIKGAKVEGTLIEEGRDKKITVIRFKAKSRYFKKKGHRQPHMKVEIASIK